jgi:hypothetical protein
MMVKHSFVEVGSVPIHNGLTPSYEALGGRCGLDDEDEGMNGTLQIVN